MHEARPSDGGAPDPDAPPWAQMNRPAPVGLLDLGPDVLDRLRDDLQMDDPWTTLDGRTLTWWGASAPLTFRAEQPRLCQGDPTVKITTAVTLVDQVTGAPAAVARSLADLNRYASVGGYTYRHVDQQIVAHLSHYAYPGNTAVLDLLAPFALLLYTEALARSEALANDLGGRPAVRPHPASGTRDDFDDLMAVTESTVLPAGHDANRWQGPELAQLPEYLTDNQIGVATGQGDGVSAEFRLETGIAGADIFSTGTSLLQLNCVEHPAYGQGLLAVLHLPVRPTLADTAQMANQLNRAELETLTGLGGWGAWCTEHDGGGLAHVGFLPNIYARPGLATTTALYAANRAAWACENLAAAR